MPLLHENLSYELELSLRITSALYSIISIFISIISIKYFIELTIANFKKSIEINTATYYIYMFYLIYILITI